MATWLAVDASTAAGSAAVFEHDRLLGALTVAMRGSDEERLMPAVVALVSEHGGWSSLDRLVVGGGPGSFTSLRIAAAIAKGLATSLGIALWSVPSLPLIVTQDASAEPGRYLAALDAMRGEYFASLVEVGDGGRVVSAGPVWRLAVDDLLALSARERARLVGPSGPMARSWYPHARGAAALLASGLGVDVELAGWEPDYGRLAEAQVKWEAAHGRPLGAAALGSPHP